MHYIILMKLRKKPDKATLQEIQKIKDKLEKNGGMLFFTLGGYDLIWHIRAKNEVSALKIALAFSKIASTETLPAISIEDAAKLV